ncbi:LAGLIDADG family homing endonuclease [Candidatus Woesearchaeota archaeon]|nr:LAGLIDADG family homing endonuclease [Candidatus Woesearchaeota archaeon]
MRIKKLKFGFGKLTKEKARIIAHLIGDGAHYKTKHDYVLKYEVRDEESLKQFNDDIIQVYGLKPSWEWNTSGITGEPIKFVRLRAKLAFEDLAKYATYFSKDWELKPLLTKAPKEIKREFLKALFDDEGSVRSRYEIYLYSINKNGLNQIKNMLNEFEIDSRIKPGFGQRKNVYALIINDLKSFHAKIGFNLKRKQERLERFTGI